MYPREQLTALERHKAVVRMRIQAERWQVARHMERVMRPVDLLSRWHARWRSLPLGVRMAAGPLGLALQRALFKRFRYGGALVLWGPVMWRVFKWALPLLKNSSLFSKPTPVARAKRILRRQAKPV